MSDRTYALLEKMYIEFTGRFEDLDKKVNDNSIEIAKLEQEMTKTNNNVIKLEQEMTKSNNHSLKLENDIYAKLGALFDAQETTNNRLDRIEMKLDELSIKVDKHDIKIQVIEGGKKKRKM